MRWGILDDDLLRCIVQHLPLETLALRLIRVDRRVCNIVVRHLRSAVGELLKAPFKLSGRSILNAKTLALRVYKPIEVVRFAGAIGGGALVQLQKLTLSHSDIDSTGMDAIATAVKNRAVPQLYGLWLHNTGIDDNGMKALADAFGKGGVRQLVYLGLNHNNFGDDGVQALARALSKGGVPSLVALYMEFNQIADVGFAELGRLDCKALSQLTRLDLYGNVIADAGMIVFANAIDSAKLPKLQMLDLGQNRFSGDGLRAFANAMHRELKKPLASLRDLDLYYEQVDGGDDPVSEHALFDEGIDALADALEAGALPALRALEVPMNSEEHPLLKSVCRRRQIHIA